MNKIVLQDPSKPYDVHDLLARLGVSITPRAATTTKTGAKSLLEVVCVDGERTYHLIRICGSYIGKGLSKDDVERICIDWNSRNNPPMDEQKVRSTVASILRTHQRNNPATASGTSVLTPLFDLSEAKITTLLRTSPPVRTWLLQDCLPLGRVALLVAPGGTGKSQLLLQLGVSVVSGIDLAGHWRVGSAGGVLLIFAEDEIDEVHRRLSNTLNQLPGYSPAVSKALEQSLFIKSVVGKPNAMTQVNNSGQVSATEYADRLILTAKQYPGIKLIVVDPASRFRAGNENAAEDMTRFVEQLERVAQETGATVLVAHHANKASMTSKGQSQSATRGSSAFTDGVRWQMNLSNITADKARELGLPKDSAHMFVLAEVTKNNYGPPQPPVTLERLAGGYLESVAHSRRPILLADRIIQLIDQEAKAGKTYSANKFEGKFAGTERTLGTGVGTIRKTIKELVNDGRLQYEGHGNNRRLKIPSVVRTGVRTGTPSLDGSSMLYGSTDAKNKAVEEDPIGNNGPSELDARRIEHRAAALENQGVRLDDPLYIEHRPSRSGFLLKFEGGSRKEPPLTVRELAWLALTESGGASASNDPVFPGHYEAWKALEATYNGPGSSSELRAAARAQIADKGKIYEHTVRGSNRKTTHSVFAPTAEKEALQRAIEQVCGIEVQVLSCRDLVIDPPNTLGGRS